MTKQCQFRRIKVRKRTMIDVHVDQGRNTRTVVERMHKSMFLKILNLQVLVKLSSICHPKECIHKKMDDTLFIIRYKMVIICN